jgi:exosortase
MLRAQVPMPFLGAIAVALGFCGFVAWDQSHWWREKDDYGFGWLVPAFVAFVVHDRWPRIKAALVACGSPGGARTGRWTNALLSCLAGCSLAGGAALFLVGALYRAAAGPSYPGTLAITLGAVALLVPTLYFHVPPTPAPTQAGRWHEDVRVRLTALWLFPCLVWLVSAPMLSAVEHNLSLFLLKKVTAVVFFVFDMLGLEIEQRGNVLALPMLEPGVRNEVGVEDACSGIRSLTACLFAGSFLAAVYLQRLWQKILLVGLALLLAVCTNMLRGIFLTSWAYNYGSHKTEGLVHDAAGYAVLGLTVVGLLCLLPLFKLKFTFGDDEEDDGDDEIEEPTRPAP